MNIQICPIGVQVFFKVEDVITYLEPGEALYIGTMLGHAAKNIVSSQIRKTMRDNQERLESQRSFNFDEPF